MNIAIEARDIKVPVPNEKMWEAVRQIGVGREEVKWAKKRWAGLGLGQRVVVDKDKNKERKNKGLRARANLHLAHQSLR
jgi:hypothetical protein